MSLRTDLHKRRVVRLRRPPIPQGSGVLVAARVPRPKCSFAFSDQGWVESGLRGFITGRNQGDDHCLNGTTGSIPE